MTSLSPPVPRIQDLKHRFGDRANVFVDQLERAEGILAQHVAHWSKRKDGVTKRALSKTLGFLNVLIESLFLMDDLPSLFEVLQGAMKENSPEQVCCLSSKHLYYNKLI